MGNFNFKLLVFYSIAIGAVAVLFNTVTGYGKTHLKAPPPVGGRYQLQFNHLPNCVQKEPKILLVEQSGIYLHGLLLDEQIEISPEVLAEEKPTLSGKWQEQALNLAGTAPHVGSCDAVRLEATQQGNNLSGRIRFGSSAEVVAFAAQKEETKPRSLHGH